MPTKTYREIKMDVGSLIAGMQLKSNLQGSAQLSLLQNTASSSSSPLSPLSTTSFLLLLFSSSNS